MAHFAKLDENNVVLDVNVVHNDVINNAEGLAGESLGIAFLTEWSGGHSNWKQTSFNGSFRERFAAIGGSYEEEYDVFMHPQPYLSWVKNMSTFKWEAPVPHPNGDVKDGTHQWNESTISWVPFTKPE